MAMFIQTEVTPNPATLKFLPHATVMSEGTQFYQDPSSAGTRQVSSHSDWCSRLVQASGTDPFGTRAHNPVGAAQRNNQPP